MTFIRRVQRSARSVSAGRSGARLILFVATGLCVGSVASVCPAAGQPDGQSTVFTLDANHVAVELDYTLASPWELQQNLADEGFRQSSPILHACGTHRVILSVEVNKVDADTLKVLRTTPGAKAARRLYSYPGTASVLVQSDQVVLKPKPGTTDAQIRDLLSRSNCEVVRTMGIGTTMYVARVKDEAATDAVATAGMLATSGLVEFAQPDMYRERVPHQVAIGDPLFSYQWHLENRGQTGGAVGADVKAKGAWAVTLGEGATVAIIDDSVQWQHPDLIDSVVARYNFEDNSDDPSPTKPFPTDAFSIYGYSCLADRCSINMQNCWGYLAHGTCTAGLAVARANDIGVRGLAPMANLVAERALYASDAGKAQAFYFAEQNGAQVISNSWGPRSPGVPAADVVRTAIEDVSRNGRGGLGCLVMFSSGNSNDAIHRWGTYAALPEVMAIGATQSDDRLSCYSNFGPEQSVVAPGGGTHPGNSPATENCGDRDITTTDITEVGYSPADLALINDIMQLTGLTFCNRGLPPPLTGYNPPPPPFLGGDDFQNNLADQAYSNRFNGTSAACPIAAGCAALVFSVDNTLTASQVRGIIEHTADKVHVDGAGYDPVTGHNDMYGYGRINAERAVNAASAGRTWPMPVTSMADGSVADQVHFQWTNPPADVDTVLIIRSVVGPLNFAPVDGRQYAVGDQVAPNAIVVANDLITSYADDAAPNGDLNYGVFVKNGANFYSWGAHLTIQSKSVPDAPQASVTASPSVGAAPLTVLFSGGAIDPQGRQIVSFAWDFGDATTGVGPSIEHTYTRPGQYLAKLTVTNSLGKPSTATVLVTVEPPGPGPAPTFTVTLAANPRGGSPPLIVTFSATASPATTLVSTYAWDFGDGTTTGTPTGSATHTYLAAGAYTAKVTVTDFLGASLTASTSIVVGATTGSQATRETSDTTAAPAACGAGAAPMMALTTLMLAGFSFVNRRSRR